MTKGHLDALSHTELRKRVMRAVVGRGLVIPSRPGPVEEQDQFPRDLTALDDVQLRQQMSQWMAQLGYLNTLMAREEADVTSYKETLRRYERAHKAGSDKKRMWEADAELSGDEYWEDQRNKLLFSETMVVQLKGLRTSFDGYYKACSRELSARLGERERDEGRGGSGA